MKNLFTHKNLKIMFNYNTIKWNKTCINKSFLSIVKFFDSYKENRQLQKLSTVVKNIDICKTFRHVIGFSTVVRISDTCKKTRHL